MLKFKKFFHSLNFLLKLKKNKKFLLKIILNVKKKFFLREKLFITLKFLL
jgi:hypothetical protein